MVARKMLPTKNQMSAMTRMVGGETPRERRVDAMMLASTPVKGTGISCEAVERRVSWRRFSMNRIE